MTIFMPNLASPVRRGASNATRVKKALFDLLRGEAGAVTGGLAGVSVDYAFNGQAGNESIYGGGWRSQFADDQIAEGPGLLLRETTALAVYIRVRQPLPAGTVEAADARADQLADVMTELLFTTPTLGAGFALTGILAGQGDYGQTDDDVSVIHAFQVSVDSLLRWV